MIGRALPVHRGHDWTARQLAMSRCDGLLDREATIKETGPLEHSRASSFFQNLASALGISRHTLFPVETQKEDVREISKCS